MINELTQWAAISGLIYLNAKVLIKTLVLTKQYESSFWSKRAYRLRIIKWEPTWHGAREGHTIITVTWNEKPIDNVEEATKTITLMPFSIKHFSIKLK